MFRAVIALVAASIAGALLYVMPTAGAISNASAQEQEVVSAKGETPLRSEAETLEPLALDRWPEDFSGAWIENGDYEEGINVAFTSKAQERVELLAENFSRPELLKAITVEHSLAKLESVQANIIADRDSALQGKGEQLAGTGSGEYDLGINVRTNRIVVRMPRVTKEAMATFSSRYGEMFEFEERPLTTLRCISRRRCGTSLRGGIAARRSSNFSIDNCSTAFVIRRSGLRHMLSAGHCGNVGHERHHGLNSPTRFGSVRDRVVGGWVDAERSSIVNGFSGIPYVYRTHSDQASPIRSQSTYNGLLIGSTVCKLGIMTGRTCGVVVDKNVGSASIPGSSRFIQVTACNDFGDSGASIIAGTIAVGILSFGDGVRTCDTTPQSDTYFGHIEYALNALGATLVYAP